MNISRRDFMKLFGVSVASLLLTHCNFPIGATCYAPLPPPTVTPGPRGKLRCLWLRFNELAQASISDSEKGNSLLQQLISEHRTALDELVASGELTAPVADLVQEAYAAAVYHVWRSSAPITCYIMVSPTYAPESAGVLLQQSEVLSQVADQGNIDPDTLAKAQTAIEHDLAFYALSDADVQALYQRLLLDYLNNNQPIPPFDEIPLDLTPDAKAAAQFIVDLLTEK